MLMITDISPRSISKYFNREFIIVATRPFLCLKATLRLEHRMGLRYYSMLVVNVITTPTRAAPLKFTRDPSALMLSCLFILHQFYLKCINLLTNVCNLVILEFVGFSSTLI